MIEIRSIYLLHRTFFAFLTLNLSFLLHPSRNHSPFSPDAHVSWSSFEIALDRHLLRGQRSGSSSQSWIRSWT